MHTLSRLAAVLLVLTTGCSLAFMTKPPDLVPTPEYPIDCTTNRAAPVLDSLCLGYFILNGVVLANATDCAKATLGQTCYSSNTITGGIVLSAGLGLLCGISAFSGYGWAGKCETQKELNARCVSGDQRACQALNPGWLPRPVGSRYQPAQVQPAEAFVGCAKDVDCKGDRICLAGRCVSPAPATVVPASPP